MVVGPHSTLFARGSIPVSLLSRFRKRKQYIFLLETLAQCLIMWVFSAELSRFCVSFCDNTSGAYSLIKDMTKDNEVNALVALFWSASGILGLDPWVEVVPTKAQLADAVSRDDEKKAADVWAAEARENKVSPGSSPIKAFRAPVAGARLADHLVLVRVLQRRQPRRQVLALLVNRRCEHAV